MSNLTNRVKKAKKLKFSHNHYSPGRYGTWGSGNDKYYNVSLGHKSEYIDIVNPDKKAKVKLTVITVDCKADTGNGKLCNCLGNERHTVCYHGLGAIYQSFKNSGKLVSFFETYESAKQMSFGGKLAKIESVNGGFLWCIVKDWPKKILSAKENIALMRGQEDEGID